jgi:hypothetical protein
VTAAGSPYAGATVVFYFQDQRIGSATTDSSGQASITYTIPFTVNGQVTITVDVYGTRASISGIVFYPTSLKVSVPTLVLVNQPFTVTVTLMYQSGPSTWTPLAGAPIVVTPSWASTVTAITDSNGNATIQLTAPSSPGTYTLTIAFTGARAAAGPAGAQPTGLVELNGLYFAPASISYSISMSPTGQGSVTPISPPTNLTPLLLSLVPLAAGAITLFISKRRH